ncbi:HAMP domain-containing protein [Leucothrix sargassi]|nr:HAMP domain-containing protein [Leucothrix sargassi]
MKKIRNKILFTMMLLTLLPVLLIGGYSFYTTSEALKDSVLQNQKNTLRHTEQQLTRTLSDVERDLAFLSDSNTLQKYLDRQSATLSVTTMLEQFTQQSVLYRTVRLLDESGQEVLRVQRDGDSVTTTTAPAELLNKSESDYFKQALNGQAPYVSPMQWLRERGEVVEPLQSLIYYSQEANDSAGRVKAVVVLELAVDALMAQASLSQGPIWGLTLLNEAGDVHFARSEWGSVVAGLNTNVFVDSALGLSSIADAKRLQELTHGDLLSLSVPLIATDKKQALGYLVSTAPQAALFKPLSDYVTISLIIVAVCLFLSFLFAMILSNSLSDPLMRLTEKVRKFSQGDLDAPISEGAKNEIGDLSQAVELLRKSMVILMKRSRKA